MKNTLGRKVFIFLALSLTLIANTNLAEYTLSANKTNVHLKEAVEISFIATQKDKSDVMFFFLEPKKSPDYKIVLLNKSAQKLAYHHKQTKFTYLLFPLTTKKISVDFDFTIKVASDSAVAQVYEGSRDNVKWIETTNTHVDLKPLILNVEALKQDVDLIGDFHLSSTIDKQNISAYESANITYTLTGVGYNDFTINPVGIIMNVDVFSDTSKQYELATKDGYKIHREFNHALLSQKDIHVKSVAFVCYSPSKEKYYTLKTQEYNIKVNAINPSSLVDKVDFPKTIDYTSTIKSIFIYILIFFSGFLTAKFSPNIFQIKKSKYADIEAVHSPKELLYLLMHKYSKKSLEVHYEALNEIVYNKGKESNFKKIKRAVIKELQS